MTPPTGFRVDSGETGTGAPAWGAFVRGWHTDLGIDQALPRFTPAATRSFRGQARVGRLDDVTLTDVRVASALRTSQLPRHHDHEARLYVVHRGSLTFEDPPGPGRQTIPAGGFALQHVRRSAHFETSPGLVAQIIALPAEPFAPLLGRRTWSGSADGPEMRLLLAHSRAVHSVIGELADAGRHAARGTLIDLARAVVLGRSEHTEPTTSRALLLAARALADTRLTDPDLTSARLAAELRVSTRTLQRAFAASGEPVRAYVLRRRLEEARAALAARPALRIADAAAIWQFTDGSHFVRSFRRQFGGTPTELTRGSPGP